MKQILNTKLPLMFSIDEVQHVLQRFFNAEEKEKESRTRLPGAVPHQIGLIFY